MPLASANDMPLAVANDMPLAFANEAWIMVTGLDVYENNSKLVQMIQSQRKIYRFYGPLFETFSHIIIIIPFFMSRFVHRWVY